MNMSLGLNNRIIYIIIFLLKYLPQKTIILEKINSIILFLISYYDTANPNNHL